MNVDDEDGHYIVDRDQMISERCELINLCKMHSIDLIQIKLRDCSDKGPLEKLLKLEIEDQSITSPSRSFDLCRNTEMLRESNCECSKR